MKKAGDEMQESAAVLDQTAHTLDASGDGFTGQTIAVLVTVALLLLLLCLIIIVALCRRR